MKLIAFFAATATASKKLFEDWKVEHDIEFASPREEATRFDIWMKNKVKSQV